MAFDSRRSIVQSIPFTKDGRPQESVICSVNSTSTPLTGSGTWTGDWVEIIEYASVSVLVFTDQPSAQNGLLVEWSTDGVNVDDNDAYTIPANDGKFYSFSPEGRYIRISYTNGANTQTEFRLQTINRYVSTKGSSHRLGDEVVDDDDSELVKAAIVGRDDSGVFQNVSVSNDAGIKRIAILGKVTVVGATPPPATTTVEIFANDPLIVGTHNTEYVIPDGEVFYLQGLIAGNEDPTKGAKVEVVYDNGTEHLIRRIYISGASQSFGFSDVAIAQDGTSLVGNAAGTNKIIVRRQKYSGTDIAIDAVITGYVV